MTPDEPVTAAADLRARWLPTPEQTDAAVALLRTVPAARRHRFYAVVALAQPGKEYGLWETGQEVVAVPGLWLGENTRGDEPTEHPLRDAQQAAEAAARSWLERAGKTGTVSFVVIDSNGHASVFEGFGNSPGTT